MKTRESCLGPQECQCQVKASGEGLPRWSHSNPSSHSLKWALISVEDVGVYSGPRAQAGLGPPVPLHSEARAGSNGFISLVPRALQCNGRIVSPILFSGGRKGFSILRKYQALTSKRGWREMG